ncbi:helix-turn-helix domain-containing protein [Streptomyces sp. NPDC048568]|uniref:AlbA family DNA-binding domain-containing protein n=1 Tax=Streptomyces sp. NPDC048568 TaxID=3365571 RepID=UPI00371C1EBE
MASSWTRIHQEIGIPPGPLTYDHIARAADEIDGERDDLDWKRDLPKKPEQGEWNEFAKDVAAMANARGGLLIYGVRNDRRIIGVNPNSVHTEHLFKWLRANTQPFVAGVDAYTLDSADSSLSVLVVDVPASTMAPHFVLGTSPREKQTHAFAVPFRYTDHTGWLAEHEIDRAYRDRFARQEATDQALERHIDRVREVVLTEGDPSVAWLIVVSKPTRPVPPLVPAPTREEAGHIMGAAFGTAIAMVGQGSSGHLLRTVATGFPQVGLRCWVEGNLHRPFQEPLVRALGERGGRRRLVWVELHHDGTVVLAVDVARLAIEKNLTPVTASQTPYAPVEVRTVQVAVCEAVALTHESRLARRIDSGSDLTAVIVCDPKALERGGLPFPGYAPLMENYSFLEVPENARAPKKILPTGSELSPGADQATLLECAQSLCDGLLSQFGIGPYNLQ